MDTSKKLTQGISEIRKTEDLKSLKEAWAGVCEDRVFLLSEIERLRRQCAEVNEECSTRVLAAQKFQMDVAQIVNDYIDHEVVYEPDPSWPPEDVRRSIINIIASEKAS